MNIDLDFALADHYNVCLFSCQGDTQHRNVVIPVNLSHWKSFVDNRKILQWSTVASLSSFNRVLEYVHLSVANDGNGNTPHYRANVSPIREPG